MLSDSGAFSDSLTTRLTSPQAMRRQLNHAKQYNYLDRLDGFASYDVLIDEKWVDGRRKKERWNEKDAQSAVEETINAAHFLDTQRDKIPTHLVLSAQGVSTKQYVDCVQALAPLFQEEDVLGLGGWCIVGRRRSLMHSFRPIIKEVVPLAAQFTRKIHIWGVLYSPAIGELLWMCDQYSLQLSTDSSGPSLRPARGVWGYMGWVDREYVRPPTEVLGLHRAQHVIACREWLSDFRNSEYYKAPGNFGE